MTLVLRYSARSDRGLVRQNNQDAVYAGPRLLALADGMGGHAAGEVASSLVISALAPARRRRPRRRPARRAARRHRRGQRRDHPARRRGPRPGGHGHHAHRDPVRRLPARPGARRRLPRLPAARRRRSRQITKDDTFVQSLIDEGRITEEEAHTHPQRSLLLRAITGQDVDPSLTIREARAGDRYLLCSDGLSGVVSDETLAETLRHLPRPARVRRPHDRAGAARRRPGQHHLHRRRRRRHRLRRGRPDRRRVDGRRQRGRPRRPDSAAARASATTHDPTRTAAHRAGPGRAGAAEPSRLRVGVAIVRSCSCVLVGGRHAGPALGHAAVLRRRRRRPGRDLPGRPRRGARDPAARRRPSAPTSPSTDLPETERSQVRDGIIASDGPRRAPAARRAAARPHARRPARRLGRPAPTAAPACRTPAVPVDPVTGRPLDAACRPRRHHPAADRARPSRARPAGRWADGRTPTGDAAPAPATPAAPAHRARASSWCCLAFAAVLVTGALVLVEANQEQELTRSLLYVGLAYLAPVHRWPTSRCAASRRTPTR